MAIAPNQKYKDAYVDLSKGQISREIFVNEEIYQRELEQVFARSWLFIGHESQIEKPGDYFISGMGEESVIMCRDRESKVHVFLNSCRHRGMKVCRYDEGNTPVFTCPYHGWSYATDGKLAGIPYFKDAYHGEIDRTQWGLVEVAQLRIYKGTVWATWDQTAPPFLEYLGDFKMFLDLSLDSWDGSEGGSEVIGGVQKWMIPCNWKFPAENFSGDSYHNISHRSVDMVGIGPSGTGRRDMNERNQAKRLHILFPERGHHTGAYLLPKGDSTPPAYQDSPVVSEYFAHCERERRRVRGEWSRLVGSPGEIFPNTALHPRQPRTIAVWHPRGVHQTEVWRWYLVDRAAPDEVKNFLREYYIRYSGPGGLTEQDDMENWNYAHSASRGTIARRYPYSYEQGLGYERADFEVDGLKFPGLVTDLSEAKSSEDNLRNLYRRWADFMDADSWDVLANWRNGSGA
ncbi:MAG: aromatic ring-hydroxylating dioxygenase subunit alpha [Chloroflexi bacterium]|nr:aromatic ring-hydroxylating dioxygenase subunit alpha [Chloroflexota bacterium]|tara:strand:- start:6152 stop:7525 length:1374 start_codon:yes stop_codon:yes gene_type:complete